MKKLFIILLVAMSSVVMGQSQLKKGVNILTPAFSLSDVSGADTSFAFSVPANTFSMAIQSILTDTIENADVSILLEHSITGVDYTALTDTLVMLQGTYPLSVMFPVITGFPFASHRVRILPDTCTDGDLKIYIYIK